MYTLHGRIKLEFLQTSNSDLFNHAHREIILSCIVDFLLLALIGAKSQAHPLNLQWTLAQAVM
jgi:hypothetical protein